MTPTKYGFLPDQTLLPVIPKQSLIQWPIEYLNENRNENFNKKITEKPLTLRGYIS